MSKHIYLGPYIECTYKPATRTEYVTGCTSAGCEKHPKSIRPNASGKFCSACGAPIGRVPVQVADRPDRYDVVGDELFEINRLTEIIWLAPNVRRKGDPRPHFDDDGEFCIDLRSVDQEAEMGWLEKAFAPEFKKLREAYATVEVKWGLHQYFM